MRHEPARLENSTQVIIHFKLDSRSKIYVKLYRCIVSCASRPQVDTRVKNFSTFLNDSMKYIAMRPKTLFWAVNRLIRSPCYELKSLEATTIAS
jgi:hypothetical protein